MQTLTRLDQVQTNLIKCKAAISAGQVKNVFDGLCDSTENLHHLFQLFQSVSFSAFQVLEQLYQDGTSCIYCL